MEMIGILGNDLFSIVIAISMEIVGLYIAFSNVHFI